MKGPGPRGGRRLLLWCLCAGFGLLGAFWYAGSRRAPTVVDGARAGTRTASGEDRRDLGGHQGEPSAASDRRLAGPEQYEGVLVDEHGAPFPGQQLVVVTMSSGDPGQWAGEEPSAWERHLLRTDTLGVFRFEAPTSRGLTAGLVFEGVSPWWRIQPRAFRLEDLGSGRAESRRFVRSPLPRREVSVRLVDSDSGEPVAGYPVLLCGWDPVFSDSEAEFLQRFWHEGFEEVEQAWVDEYLLTDDAGRAVSLEGYPSGEVALEFPREPQLRRVFVDHDAAGEEVVIEVAVDVGALLYLDLPGAEEGPGRELCATVALDPEGMLRAAGMTMPGPGALDCGKRVVGWEVLTGPYRVWLPRAVVQEPIGSLVVMSADGRRFGYSSLPRVETSSWQPLVVTLQERASLNLEVRSTGEGGWGVAVLAPRGPDSGGMLFERALTLDGPGAVCNLRFEGVPAGPYQLSATVGICQYRGDLVVTAGGELYREIVLESRAGPECELRGTVRTTSGAVPNADQGVAWAASRIWLESLDRPDNFRARVVWGLDSGAFEFTGVPSGTYRLSLLWELGCMPTIPESTIVSLPDSRSIAIVIEDRGPTTAYDLLVETGSGDPLPEGTRITLWWESGSLGMIRDGVSPSVQRVDHDGVEYRFHATTGSCPEGGEVAWWVTAPGYVPSRGKTSDFTSPVGGRRLGRAKLRPGWGAKITVRDVDGEPLADVVLLLDGQPQVPTDREGVVFAATVATPKWISVAGDAWALGHSRDGWGFVDEASGRFATWVGLLSVTLVRAR
jgi:hypothetical protein